MQKKRKRRFVEIRDLEPEQKKKRKEEKKNVVESWDDKKKKITAVEKI